MQIPFNKPSIVGKEIEYISESVRSGHISGDGIFSKKCSMLLQNWLGVKKVFLTPSGTAALEMAAMLTDINEEDEVIIPTFTFVSTVNAFYMRRAKIVFADILEDTLNIDHRTLNEICTKRTKVIVPVHYGGISCEMDEILELARMKEIMIVEDAAHGIGAKYRNRYLGSLGTLGVLSFHETKNCICGEGGALLVNDESLIERAEIIREKGTNRSKYFRGEIDKYTWVDIGSSYLLSDILAAFLYAQLEKADDIMMVRKNIFETYYAALKPLGIKGYLRLPVTPENVTPNYHTFYIILENQKTRDALLAHLQSMGIHAVFHYVPLHLSPMGRSLGYGPDDYPVTERLSGRLLRLPMYFSLQQNEIEQVCGAIKSFFER